MVNQQTLYTGIPIGLARLLMPVIRFISRHLFPSLVNVGDQVILRVIHVNPRRDMHGRNKTMPSLIPLFLTVFSTSKVMLIYSLRFLVLNYISCLNTFIQPP